MIIFPAIDLFEGQAVRLFKGDYSQKTVYGDPLRFAEDFKKCGARYIHIVDLEGAKNGNMPNFETVKNIKHKTGLFVEVGGGIRDIEAIKKYIDVGIDRVILGTAAIFDKGFLESAIKTYGDRIAVGADIKDGYIAVKGWTEKSDKTPFSFLSEMQAVGVKTVVCTDVQKDGAMQGTNIQLYKTVSEKFDLNIIASGGVSSIQDVIALNEIGVYGAIIGKAYYTGAVSLKEAIEVTR